MTQQIILVLSLVFSGFGYAQDIAVKDVPAAVKNSFNKAFPKASQVEWELAGDLYNAEFDLGRRDHEVWINGKGGIVKHKQEIRGRELPEAVSKRLKQDYKGFWIDEAERFEVGKQFFYKVELQKLTEEKNVVLDSRGKVVNRIL